MRLKEVTILGALGLLLLGVVGCSNSHSPISSDPTEAPPVEAISLIPTGAVIDSARMMVFVNQTDPHQVSIHPVTSDWSQTSVTWNSFADAFDDGDTVGTFTFSRPGWYALNADEVVNDWMSGELDNFGLYVKYGGAEAAFTRMLAGGGISGLHLLVCYSDAGGSSCERIRPTDDATISQSEPNRVFGMYPDLKVGGVPGENSTLGALIKFDLPVVVQYSSIGGRVFEKTSDNGLSDIYPGVAGVTVNLYDCSDSLLATATTDGDGVYGFDSLKASDYRVGFDVPEGYTIDLPKNGMTDCLTLLPGEDVAGVDAALKEEEIYDGCTQGKGYWMRRCGCGPQSDGVTELLPIWLGTEGGKKSIAVTDAKTAHRLLAQKSRSRWFNGISKLYAHLLTAKLNIANKADPSAVAHVIEKADLFLAEHNTRSWRKLSWAEKRQVYEWKRTLNHFNEGKIGPGKCDTDDGTFSWRDWLRKWFENRGKNRGNNNGGGSNAGA